MFKLAKGSWLSLRLHVRVLGNFMIISWLRGSILPFERNRWIHDSGRTTHQRCASKQNTGATCWKSLWNPHGKFFQWSPMNIAMSLARYSHLTSLRSANYHLVNILTFHQADKTWYSFLGKKKQLYPNQSFQNTLPTVKSKRCCNLWPGRHVWYTILSGSHTVTVTHQPPTSLTQVQLRHQLRSGYMSHTCCKSIHIRLLNQIPFIGNFSP